LEKKEYDKAINDFNEAIVFEPDNAWAFSSRGFAWYMKKEYDKAIKDYDEAIRLNPANGWATNGRGNAWFALKEYDRAMRDYDDAIRLDPKSAWAFNNRAITWSNKKRYDKAISDHEEAIRLDPKESTFYCNLAWVLISYPEAKLGDNARAIELARKACDLTDWKKGLPLSILAAAYAKGGQFEKAEQYQKEALQDPAYQGSAGDDFRQRLEFYKQRKVARASQPDERGANVSPPSPAPDLPHKAADRDVDVTLRYMVVSRAKANQPVALAIILPRGLDGKQRVRQIRYSLKPTEVSDSDGDSCARFVLNPGTDVIEVYVKVTLWQYDLVTASMLPKNRRQLANPNPGRWLKHELHIETNAPAIREAARAIQGETDEEQVGEIVDLIGSRLHYKVEPGDHGALEALQRGVGKCEEFSELFVALCRAKNMPARTWDGPITTPVQQGETAFHRWAEVYLREYGWVPVDPTWAAMSRVSWKSLQPVRIYLTCRPNKLDFVGRVGGWSYATINGTSKSEVIVTSNTPAEGR